MAIKKSCENCGEEFYTYPSVNKKSCSVHCSREVIKKENYNRYKCNCEVCGEEFLPKRQKEGGRFCSYACSGKSNRKERVDRSGYWFVCKPEHPRASAQGYVGEHTLVMEKHLRRYLVDGEVVHHRDHDRKNNSIENLQLMSITEHKRQHMLETHAAGKLWTEAHRSKASIRMQGNTVWKHAKRSADGRFYG